MNLSEIEQAMRLKEPLELTIFGWKTPLANWRLASVYVDGRLSDQVDVFLNDETIFAGRFYSKDLYSKDFPQIYRTETQLDPTSKEFRYKVYLAAREEYWASKPVVMMKQRAFADEVEKQAAASVCRCSMKSLLSYGHEAGCEDFRHH